MLPLHHHGSDNTMESCSGYSIKSVDKLRKKTVDELTFVNEAL